MNLSRATFDLHDVPHVVAGALCPFLFLSLSSITIGVLVFRPLYVKGLYVPPTTRFRIVDIVILLFQLQVTGMLAVVYSPSWLFPSDSGPYIVALTACLLIVTWWLTGIRMLSKAQVERGSQRALFLTLTLPLGYLAAVGIAFSPVTIMVVLATLLQIVTGPTDGWSAYIGLLLSMLNAAIVAAVVLAYRHCQIMVEQARDDAAKREGIEFGPIVAPTKRPSITMASEVSIVD